jgi:hypothetical protein
MPIVIPKGVFEGILAVRDSGGTNMLNRPRVIELLEDMGFDEGAEWVSNHKSEYSLGIFQGFQPDECAGLGNGGES